MFIRISLVCATFLALFVVAALFSTAAPTTAQDTSPVPTPTPLPTLPITESELAELCDSAQIYVLEADVSRPEPSQPRTVTLAWWDYLVYDLLIYDLEEPPAVSYRIQRQSADAGVDAGWQTLATVTGATSWVGEAELGSWVYRVAVVEINVRGASRECKPDWAEVNVDVLSADDLIEAELQYFCDEVEIYGLYASVSHSTNWPDETLTLRWNDTLQALRNPDYHPESLTIHHRIEQATAPVTDNTEWQLVAEVIDETTWTGSAEPGTWVYRVAVVKIQDSGVEVECDPKWEFADVRILTEAERAKLERQRSILITESVRCATDDLTSNLRSPARSVVSEYVEERIGVIFAELDNSGDEASSLGALVYWTILMCSDERPNFFGFNLGQSWAMLLLFDDFDDFF